MNSINKEKIMMINGNSNKILFSDIIKMLEYKYHLEDKIQQYDLEISNIKSQCFFGKIDICLDKINLINENIFLFLELNTETNIHIILETIKQINSQNPKNIILVFTTIDQNLYYCLSSYFESNDIYNFVYLDNHDMDNLLDKTKEYFFINKIYIPDCLKLTDKSMMNKDIEVLNTDEIFTDKIYDMILKMQ